MAAEEELLKGPVRAWFQREGTELACLDFGGNDSPVLLLHGLAGHAAEWNETARWLRSAHRVVALDERGHGWSAQRPADVSRDAHVADVAHVIESLELAPVIVIGQSLGAQLAFLVASRHPELVRALVVAEGSPDGDPEGEAAASIRAWLDSWPAPFPTRRAAEAFFGAPSLYATAWSDGLEQREDGLWPRFDVEVMVRTLREGVERDYWEEWERIRCPTLVLKAERGFFPGDALQKMAERLPGARYAQIPGAKHDLHLDRPADWREAITGFIETLDAGPADVAGRVGALLVPAGLEDGVLRLVSWGEADLEAVEEASRDEAITRITAVPRPFSPEAGIAFLRARAESAVQGQALSLAIHDKQSGATLGGVNLNTFDWRRRSATVGYWVIASRRGRRVATRALNLITAWALRELGLRKLEAHIEADNFASIRTASAAGYRAQGTVKARPFGKEHELEMLRYVREA